MCGTEVKLQIVDSIKKEWSYNIEKVGTKEKLQIRDRDKKGCEFNIDWKGGGAQGCNPSRLVEVDHFDGQFLRPEHFLSVHRFRLLLIRLFRIVDYLRKLSIYWSAIRYRNSHLPFTNINLPTENYK